MIILKTLKLLIPALVPSWNFFDIITASPRIQYILMGANKEQLTDWQEFRPRPKHLSLMQMIRRMLWNANWNETMFAVGCAERLMSNPTKHSEEQIMKRIILDLENHQTVKELESILYVQFRLVYIERRYEILDEEVTYYSQLETLPKS